MAQDRKDKKEKAPSGKVPARKPKPSKTTKKESSEAKPKTVPDKAKTETKKRPSEPKVSAATSKGGPQPEPRTSARAQAKYLRRSARKVRLVADHIRGKSVGEARAILQFSARGPAQELEKLLDSAVANAENNHDLVGDELEITQLTVDEGPTLKRYRPRAMGRATPIMKRTCHVSVSLRPRNDQSLALGAPKQGRK